MRLSQDGRVVGCRIRTGFGGCERVGLLIVIVRRGGSNGLGGRGWRGAGYAQC